MDENPNVKILMPIFGREFHYATDKENSAGQPLYTLNTMYTDVIDIAAYPQKNKKDSMCFHVFIAFENNNKLIMKIHGIKYPYQPNCTLSGKLILKTLIKIAKQIRLPPSFIPNSPPIPLSLIRLEDESEIVLSYDEKTEKRRGYSLPLYSIICEGKTWYEREGFRCEDLYNGNKEIHDFFASPENNSKLTDGLLERLKESGKSTVKELLLSIPKTDKERIYEIMTHCKKTIEKNGLRMCTNMVMEIEPEPEPEPVSSEKRKRDAPESESIEEPSSKKGGKKKNKKSTVQRRKKLLRKTKRKK